MLFVDGRSFTESLHSPSCSAPPRKPLQTSPYLLSLLFQPPHNSNCQLITDDGPNLGVFPEVENQIGPKVDSILGCKRGDVVGQSVGGAEVNEFDKAQVGLIQQLNVVEPEGVRGSFDGLGKNVDTVDCVEAQKNESNNQKGSYKVDGPLGSGMTVINNSVDQVDGLTLNSGSGLAQRVELSLKKDPTHVINSNWGTTNPMNEIQNSDEMRNTKNQSLSQYTKPLVRMENSWKKFVAGMETEDDATGDERSGRRKKNIADARDGFQSETGVRRGKNNKKGKKAAKKQPCTSKERSAPVHQYATVISRAVTRLLDERILSGRLVRSGIL